MAEGVEHMIKRRCHYETLHKCKTRKTRSKCLETFDLTFAVNDVITLKIGNFDYYFLTRRDFGILYSVPNDD